MAILVESDGPLVLYEISLVLTARMRVFGGGAAVPTPSVPRMQQRPLKDPPERPLEEPRSWLDQSRLDPKKRDPFGRAGTPGTPWKEPTNPTEAALIAAAKAQHDLSRKIRQYRNRINATTDEIAEQIGRSPDWVRRVLNGSIHVSLTDLHLIAATIDAHIDADIRIGAIPGVTPAVSRGKPA